MELKYFQRKDYEEFVRWFDDPELYGVFGRLNEEWLECVLKEDPPAQFSFFDDGQLVAVMGIAVPSQNHPYFVITDIAVDPQKKRNGIGAKVIRQLRARYIDSGFSVNEWRAYVETDNEGGQKFFSSLGWTRDVEIDDGMYCFRLSDSHRKESADDWAGRK